LPDGESSSSFWYLKEGNRYMRIFKYIKSKWQAWRCGELGEDRGTLRETRRVFGSGAARRVFRRAAIVISLVMAAFCLVYWVICLIAAGGGN